MRIPLQIAGRAALVGYFVLLAAPVYPQSYSPDNDHAARLEAAITSVPLDNGGKKK